ncbi:MAG: prepilin-type N-terminal cleavage/methylation domain-containing protein [Planctomycetota bacterium]
MRTRTRTARRGFSLVEMLVALTISSTLLTAALVALDAMFQGYKQTTESASTHLVSRMVMTRLLGLIRTGEEFGPFPNFVFDANENPVYADYVEWVSERDANGNATEITRIEFRPAGGEALLQSWGQLEEADGSMPQYPDGGLPGELWFVLLDPTIADTPVVTEQPLLNEVRQARFILRYDRGPSLVRATIDLIVEPNDSRDLTVGSDSIPQTIRLVASAAPRMNTLD